MKTRIVSNLMAGVVTLIVGGLAASSQAIPVYPNIPNDSCISFIGGATLDGSIGAATAYDTIFSTTVLAGSQTGAYASVPDSTSVTFTPFTFNPAPASSFQLWTFTVGSTVYSFEVDANSVTVATQNSTFLNLTGTGVAQITGYADTPGTFSLTDTGGPVFTFGASTCVVPEPSAAVMLGFGALLLTFGLRKQARA